MGLFKKQRKVRQIQRTQFDNSNCTEIFHSHCGLLSFTYSIQGIHYVNYISSGDQVEGPVSIPISNSDTTRLFQLIRSVTYDGGTCFGSLEIRRQIYNKYTVDFYLMFTGNSWNLSLFILIDGVNTLGASIPSILEVTIFGMKCVNGIQGTCVSIRKFWCCGSFTAQNHCKKEWR